MKLVIIQSLLPKYSIAFFNRIAERNPQLELFLVADIETKNPLNQYLPGEVRFNVVHVPQHEYRGIVFRPKLTCALRALAPDVVVFSANPRDVSQLWVMLVYWVCRRRFMVWGMFHRIGGPRIISLLYYRLVASIAESAMTYSRTGALTLLNVGVSKSKIKILGTAIDESIPIAKRECVTEGMLAQFKIDNQLIDKQVVLQVVRLSRLKRPDLLIDAAELVLHSRPDVLFILVGNGEMREELEQAVIAKGMQLSFRFLGAIYDESLLAKWYMSASVFVVPTCIGLSAHHAMCYGVPIVTDNSLDNQASEFDILSDGVNALFYAEGSVESLAVSLLKVIDSPVLAGFLSRNAIYTVTNIHTLDHKVSNFNSVLYSESIH